MSEHMHEWEANIYYYEAGSKVTCDCGAEMETDEIERRLNATECLSAGHCREICNLTEELAKEVNELLDGNISITVKKDDPLLQYARLLEGKD